MTLEIDWPDAGAAAVDGAMARLRSAGRDLRERPRAEIIDALGEVLERWRDPASAIRQALARELPAATGFSSQVVEAGLATGLADWSADALRAAVAREIAPIETAGAVASGFATTSVLLAGSIPMPTLLSVIVPLALQSTALVRPAARDLATARLVASSIGEVDAELGRCFEVVSFPREDDAAMRRFLAADCVVASGSDETLAAVRRVVGPAQRMVGYGHRLSLAVIGPGATSGDALSSAGAGLALDTALWDQLGCLSPLAVFVEDPDPAAAGRVAAALAGALEECEARLPRGEVHKRAAAAIAAERAEAEMRSAAGSDVAVLGSGPAPWTVVREDSALFRSAPLHRFLRVHPIADRAALRAALGPLERHLSAVAVAGFDAEQRPALVRDLAQLGASRLCRPGCLQAPPIGWHHDGQPLFLPLARITDPELPS